MANTSTTSTGGSDTASSSACPEMSAEQEFCLFELETTDSTSVGLVLRAIYDTGDVRNFTRALERRIAHYDKNILKVCTYHYQGFLDSMKQLSNLTERCTDIKKMTEEINEHVQSDSADLLKKSSEIVRYRKLQRNANVAIDQISMCLPALEHYANLQKLMKAQKYLQALKVLEDLEHNYLGELQKYRFAHFLTQSIGPTRDQIREKSYSELTDFLENLQKISGKIGEDASGHTAKKSQIFGGFQTPTDSFPKISNSSNTDIQLSEDGSLLKKTVKGESQNAAKSKVATDEDNQSAQDRLDFGPVHRCCQIFNVLGDKERFEVYYRRQRLEQARVIIQPPTKMSESIHAYVRYLEEIIGFFVVEDRIMQSQASLVTSAHKDQLWEMALQKVTETMNSHFGNCLNVEMMLKMKKVILLFILTMKSYGYNISPLYLLLQNFRDQYNEILMTEYCAQFEAALQADNYTPIVANNEEEFKAVVDEFPYKRALDQEDYPRKFPFSQFVPKVFTQAKGYLLSCLRFMENLQLSQSEINDTVRRYANVLLARWSGSLKIFVTSKQRSLIQLIQITINMGYLERSCENLETYISKIVNQGDASTESGHLLTLKNQVFRDARSEVEQLIDDALKEKVSAFLEISNYDWELTTPSGMASDYITDLLNFLNTTFTSFTNLPNVLAKHVCMQTCKHLAESLHSMMISPDLKCVSAGALEQFSLDVMQCEFFTAQCPVPGFEDAALSVTFASLRQLLDLVMSNDWTTYLAERGQRNSKYSRVKASNAAILLEKIMECEKKNSSFFGIGRGDRKKLYDTILRNLRALQD
ncbi:exocyst complex subunit sec15-like domain-containing protein [Ditylenchus destructor]|nr:exocyst complex subunit sec15-like domain-containing protein [Ditylenchus destructor]